MLLTIFLRSLVGLIWLIALVAATVIALPILVIFGCLVLVWKLLALLAGVRFFKTHRYIAFI